MEINIFDTIAAVVNFFVLLIILQKLFYKPIQKVMQERQAKIEALVQESLMKAEEADVLIQEYKGKIASISTQEQVTMRMARQKAEEAKDALFAEYKIEVEKRKDALLKEIEEDKKTMEREMLTVLGRNSLRIASNILSYISDEALEEKLFAVFLNNLKTLDSKEQEELFVEKDGSLELTSANPLSKEQQKELEAVLREVFSNASPVMYTVDATLVLGFELKMESYLIRISIKKYLDQMGMNILKTIDARF